MALKQNAKQQKNNFPPQPDMEAGTYPARLVQIIDLGLQPQRAFKGQEKAPANEVMWTYEFVDCFMVDENGDDIEDKPRWVSETHPWYGVHVEKSNGAKRYAALDPDGVYDGDLAQCIETPVNVTVVINKKGDKTYTNIANTSPMRPRDAAKCPELKNPTKVFDLDNPDMDVFNSLPGWIQDKIKGNLEYAGSALEKALKGVAEKPAKAEEKDEKPLAKKPKQNPKAEQEDDDQEALDAKDDLPW